MSKISDHEQFPSILSGGYPNDGEGFAGLPFDQHPSTVSNQVFNVPSRGNFELANSARDFVVQSPLRITGFLLLK